MRKVLIATSMMAALVASAMVSPARAQGLPDGPNRKLFEDTCGGCHGADIVIGQNGTKERWADTVDAMRNRGATGSESDFTAIIGYLAKYFGNPVNVNKADAKALSSDLDLSDAEAAAIVKYRADKGDFKAYDDLSKVSGLDMKKLEPLKQRITFK